MRERSGQQKTAAAAAAAAAAAVAAREVQAGGGVRRRGERPWAFARGSTSGCWRRRPRGQSKWCPGRRPWRILRSCWATWRESAACQLAAPCTRCSNLSPISSWQALAPSPAAGSRCSLYATANSWGGPLRTCCTRRCACPRSTRSPPTCVCAASSLLPARCA
eukprot:jgi/Mesen1/2103/ME000151S01368